MSVKFHPSLEDAAGSHNLNYSLEDRIELLASAAEKYKAEVMDMPARPVLEDDREFAPKDIPVAFNWGEMASMLVDVRDLPEGDEEARHHKSHMLKKLAEIYEVLRAARMSKLEAVRLALITEANQLKGDAKSPNVA